MGRSAPSTQHSALVLGMAVAVWGVFAWALIGQHRAYNSNAFDLGFFDQVIWNTAHGRPFVTSFVPYNFAGQHVEPVLLLFALPYRLWPNVELLLLVQAGVVALAALPLYAAARRLLLSAGAALCVAAAYLVAPHLHGAVLFDFHPELFGTALLFGAFALLVAGKPWWSVGVAAGLLLLKEDAALAALGFALVIWLRGERRAAVALALLALVYLAVVAGVVMPAIRGGPGDLQERYGYLGVDAHGVVLGALRHPDLVVRQLAGAGPRAGLLYMLGTMALLPLAGPAVLAAAPVLALNLLVTHPAQHELTLHYAILPFTLLFIATVLGIEQLARSPRMTRLWRWLRLSPARRIPALASLLLLCQTVAWLIGSPLGLRFDPSRYQESEHTATVGRVLALVPADVPLSAQSGLLPHRSQRRDVWEFPRLENAEVVVVDTKSWHSSQAGDAGYTKVLAALPSLGFCLVTEADGVRLYDRRQQCASP